MPYFKEIKQFIHVINNKKEKLVKITGFKALKVPKKINYNVKEIENFIEELKEALDSSQKQKKLILFLSETFWKGMTQVLGKPSDDNIYYLFQLLKNFKKYFEVVKSLYKKEYALQKNAEETNEKDELAVILNRIIQKNIEEDKEINKNQILNQISQFDIYYNPH